ncbi:MAG: hypothetical protein N2Z60_09485, partial [Elusimicrobiales bacterium]|nr:hypothetical protein [Elusimicrobiales bacterium]
VLWKIIWFIWSNTFGRMWRHKHVIEYNKKEWIDKISKYFKVEETKNHFYFDLIIKCKKI